MEKREEILKQYIAISPYASKDSNLWAGGTQQFQNVPLSVLETLIEKNLLDKNEQQNDSPTTEEFMELMREVPNLLAHGYIVSEKRQDARTTIEGLAGTFDESALPTVIDSMRHADEFNLERQPDGKCYVYSWWD